MQLDLLEEKEYSGPAYDLRAVSIDEGTMPSRTHDVTTEHISGKAPEAFKTISEVADFLDVPQHVLRFWENRFPQIKPLKMRGGRRYYRPQDIEILSAIKHLLYKQGYTIKGAKKIFAQKLHRSEILSVSETRITAASSLSERQHSQLGVIRQELIGLRDVLRHYVL